VFSRSFHYLWGGSGGMMKKKVSRLSKRQQVNILKYCLKRLHSKCKKYSKLFSDKDTDDLVEEIAIHIWMALIRYRRKPRKQALMLAYRTGQNRLLSIVRSKMTVIKGGSKIVMTGDNADDLYWTSSHGMMENGIKIIETLEVLGSIAIQLVGYKKSDSLLKALLYDWRSKNLTPRQRHIMLRMNASRTEMRDWTKLFSDEVQKQIAPGEFNLHDSLMEKKDGRWKLSKSE
jgi:hypothetical protein